MPQETGSISPNCLNLDAAFEKLSPNESPFIKGLSSSLNSNPNIGIGANNPTEEGQNTSTLTPTRSNVKFPDILKPVGYNKNIGSYESTQTQELYYFNYNGLGKHGIYVINGNTGVWNTVIVDTELNFSDNQDNFIAPHRVKIRVVYDEQKNIIEKHLLITDGNGWQKWINVIAAINTNGFDAAIFPYWTLQQPHFDRRELFEWAVRPPMIAPAITKLANTDADKGVLNRLIDSAFEICYNYIYTDGRTTTVSPFSLPLIVKTTEFLSNTDSLSKKAQVELYAGSCMVEKINIYYRFVQYKQNAAGTDFTTFGDWYLYETINKYSSCGENAFDIIGNSYWLRKNAWEQYSYDTLKNSIKYVFDNSRLGQIIPQDLFVRIQSDQPQKSIAITDLGDSLALANNLSGYDNLSCEITNNIVPSVEYQSNTSCTVPDRKVKLYVMASRERGNQSTDSTPDSCRDSWITQVGYYNGDDKQMRFGGISYNSLRLGVPYTSELNIDVDESKYFNLDFADKEGFKVYFKGTKYSANVKWYVLREDRTFVAIPNLLNATVQSDKDFIFNTLQGKGMFIGVAELEVPAGRYIATLGRHNVSNDGDYENQSTYIMGIANSLNTSDVALNIGLDPSPVIRVVNPNTALVTTSKEMEIDCTSGDVDVWGNGADLFFVCTPFIGAFYRNGVNNRWAFLEGYLYKTNPDKTIPMEQYPYDLDHNKIGNVGVITDKNGFFWGYSWRRDTGADDARKANVVFTAKMGCTYPHTFTILNGNDGEPGWKKNLQGFVSDYPSVPQGFGNEVVYTGRITDPTGLIGYSNIAVSIKDGATDYTDQNGNFRLLIHNGVNFNRVSNVYLNASGNFLITDESCNLLPLFNYNEALSPCQNITERVYPIQINQKIRVQGSEQTSLKSNATYEQGIVLADLAGRMTFLNPLKLLSVDSFNKRNSVSASSFKWDLLGALNLNNNPRTKDFKWISFYTSLATNYKKYIQWVGDKIEYIDASGNVTTTPQTASLVRITIDSLLNTNIKKNFTLLSTYQFVRNDRLRIYDDGNGQLYDTATYGDIIDVEIQGTNYNQAAVNANLIPSINTNNVTGTDPTTLYVTYDNRFDKLKDKTAFWIELYSPSENNERLPFLQIEGWMPVINGEIAEYVSGSALNPVYNYPTSGKLNFWDTYFLRRSISIPNLGNVIIQHYFESPNITDTWGYNCNSAGKPNTVNPYAKQLWYVDSIIRSDDFISEGFINGLGTFRSENRKSFKGSQRGGIVAIGCQFSLIFFLCENDYFVTDFNYNFIYANAQGVQVANLDNNLGVPHQKIGSNYGCSMEDTGTIIFYDRFIYWLDRKNESWVVCDYRSAEDISSIQDKEGGQHGVKSYLYKKIQFINDWNLKNSRTKRFDIVSGIDVVRKNIYLTFRPRRNNSNDLNSYITKRRDIDLKHQETLVYNIDESRWTKFENFTAESYGNVRGLSTGMQFVSFAAGEPYLHTYGAVSFLNFFGIQTEPIASVVLNKNENTVKILQAVQTDLNNTRLFIDLIFTTQVWGYSYLSSNQFVERDKLLYAAFLKDMISYLAPNNEENYRSTLIDGKRIFGEYIYLRFIQEYGNLGNYFEMNELAFVFTQSQTVKP